MRIDTKEAFTTSEISEIEALTARARRADGAEPFSDDLWQQAASGRTHRALTLSTEPTTSDEPTTLAGVAFAGTQGERRAAELLIHPDARGRGHGKALLAELLDATSGELWLWSHGDHPAARTLAHRHGLERARELHQMRRPVTTPVPATQPPAGVSVRTFTPGADEEAWLAVNAAAFSWHPEQGSRTLDDLRRAEAEPWFDPTGFFLAVDASGEVIGFHWTKIHPSESTGDAPLGEVYVLGVHPRAHGSGLGRHLAAVGLEYLAGQPGVEEIMLYVEGDNAAALRVYQRLEFAVRSTDVAYRRPV